MRKTLLESLSLLAVVEPPDATIQTARGLITQLKMTVELLQSSSIPEILVKQVAFVHHSTPKAGTNIK